MFSQKIAALVIAGLFALVFINGCAQVSPEKTVVNLGDLGLAGIAASSASGSAGGAQANDQLINASSMNNSTMINSSLNSSASNNPLVNDSSMSAPAAQPIDLSRYSQDRRNKNLAGYRNIMYPFAESRGSTASTSGSGGCGCGG